MRFIFKFIAWYLLMWIILIPMGWYFIDYFEARYEMIKYLSLGIYAILLLILIFCHSFRMLIWSHLTFFYRLLEYIDARIEKRKLRQMENKDYVYIKKIKR